MKAHSTESIPLRRLDDTRWEIPQSFDPGMRVPGLIFADEKLIGKIKGDQSLRQVANVAHLPGIVRYSLAMPDIHWGYGFPIGGVAATDPEEGGVISPGGIGFDINCLSAETKILHRYGYYRTIRKIVAERMSDPVRCYSLETKGPQSAQTQLVLWKEPTTQVVELITANGRRIVATEDHPFLTPSGMKLLGELERGERVAVDPFEGVPYENPGEEILVSEEDVLRFLSERGKTGGNAVTQILNVLRRRKLLPLPFPPLKGPTPNHNGPEPSHWEKEVSQEVSDNPSPPPHIWKVCKKSPPSPASPCSAIPPARVV